MKAESVREQDRVGVFSDGGRHRQGRTRLRAEERSHWKGLESLRQQSTVLLHFAHPRCSVHGECRASAV